MLSFENRQKKWALIKIEFKLMNSLSGQVGLGINRGTVTRTNDVVPVCCFGWHTKGPQFSDFGCGPW
jgi:hypothetical protein